MSRLLKVRRRLYFTLIEVMVALSILTLTLIPLLYPHFAILQEERRFVDEVELDRLANLLYYGDLKKMVGGEFDWAGELDKTIEIATPIRGFSVERELEIAKKKPSEDPRYFLIQITYRFTQKSKVYEAFFYQFLSKEVVSDSA